jgi:hypothetical protein
MQERCHGARVDIVGNVGCLFAIANIANSRRPSAGHQVGLLAMLACCHQNLFEAKIFTFECRGAAMAEISRISIHIYILIF